MLLNNCKIFKKYICSQSYNKIIYIILLYNSEIKGDLSKTIDGIFAVLLFQSAVQSDLVFK